MEVYILIVVIFLAIFYLGKKLDKLTDTIHEISNSFVSISAEHAGLKKNVLKNTEYLDEFEESHLKTKMAIKNTRKDIVIMSEITGKMYYRMFNEFPNLRPQNPEEIEI